MVFFCLEIIAHTILWNLKMFMIFVLVIPVVEMMGSVIAMLNFIGTMIS